MDGAHQFDPSGFNMARYCLEPDGPRRGDRAGLIVVHQPPGDPLAESPEVLTFADLDQQVRRVAAGLVGLGLRPGDRVLIRLGNTSDFAVTFFAAMAAGLIAVPTSSMLTGEEAAVLIADSGAAVAVVDPGLPVDLPEGVRRLGPDQITTWRQDGQPIRYADTAPDHPAFIVYTSGTTGVPKGVVHAHRSAWGRRPMHTGWQGLGPDDILVHAGAFSWTYTLGVGLTDPWANGATAVVYNGPRDPGVWAAIIEATRATMMAAVPGVYRQLLRHTDLSAYDLRSLRHALVAGEALHPDLWRHWRSVTGTDLFEALGMSEISTFVSSGPLTPTRPGSPGRVQHGRRVRVIGVDGGTDPVPIGETGLLAVHRDEPGLMLGYWRTGQPPDLPLRGDWFVSSDLVSLDRDGYLHYHGRHDDVMTAMGYRVSPLEVERVLATHPQVADVAVTQVQVRGGVRIIAAFVVPAEPDDPELVDAATILRHAHDHLAAYKCPREVVFVDALPRTGNGKVRRVDLAARYLR